MLDCFDVIFIVFCHFHSVCFYSQSSVCHNHYKAKNKNKNNKNNKDVTANKDFMYDFFKSKFPWNQAMYMVKCVLNV